MRGGGTAGRRRRSAAAAECGGDGAKVAGTVVLAGSPNVGKSLIFNRLTGRYVVVSNYPGTTVEISRGRLRLKGETLEVVDTPGIYSLSPITAEEQVAFDCIFSREARAVAHVIDAKNIGRMLPLTLQMAEAGLPLLLVLNMADEAAALGFRFDLARLREMLGVPVVRTVATRGLGIRRLKSLLGAVGRRAPLRIDYDRQMEDALGRLVPLLAPLCPAHLPPRSLAVLLLQGGRFALERLLPGLPSAEADRVLREVAAARQCLDHAAHCHIAFATRRLAERIIAAAVRLPPVAGGGFRDRLGLALMRPWPGIPVLLVVVYLLLYRFVGVFGAGTVVDFLSRAFERHVLPPAERLVAAVVPWPVLRDLFTGEYGIVSLALRYALAIVLPVVGLFFLAFSLLEDSGYLPRLALLADRLFKRLGLNGRAVIPLVLGLGCGTMATLVTRTLETGRERLIATLLLALAIPCSAQMGLIMALLAAHPGGLLLWAGAVGVVFLLSGFLAARLLPGPEPSFYMELAPLRLPRLDNIAAKTLSRMAWYFREVLPVFVLASLLIWIGQLTGLFRLLIRCLEPAAGLLGLPPQVATVFLFGFFRRDYGAAGLYDLQAAGVLDGNQIAVAAITLTLFLPCIAQFLVMGKERGWRAALLIGAVALLLALSAGWAASRLLAATGAVL